MFRNILEWCHWFPSKFIDALSMGVMLPILSERLRVLNGTQAMSSVLAALNSLCQICLRPVINYAKESRGACITLFFLFTLGLISHLGIKHAETRETLILFRCIFYVANHVQSVCNGIVPYIEPNTSKHPHEYSLLYTLQILGLTIGPIIGTKLFINTGNCFSCVMSLIVGLASLNLANCLFLPTIEYLKLVRSNSIIVTDLGTKIVREINGVKTLMTNFPARTFRLVLAIRILSSFGFYVFFAKYSSILKARFNITYEMKGYTMAYQHLMLFVTNHLSIYVIRLTVKPSRIHRCLIIVLISQTFFMFNICYARSYVVYLMCYVPLAFTRVFFENIWNIICQNLEEVKLPIRYILRMMDICSPILLGTVLNLELEFSIKFFILLPIIISTLLSFMYKRVYIPIVSSTMSTN